MKKFAYVVAALVGIAVVAPTVASAQSVVIRTGHDHMGMRDHHRHDGWRHREGWRHHHHRDRVVVIKHRH
jgi:hypothetical protein